MLSRPKDAIDKSDIRSLIDQKVPEDNQIEFKEGLPAKSGSDDPWVSGQNKIGDKAKNTIVKEVVAFANANGGVLLLGIRESAEHPRIACEVIPIPRCTELAEYLSIVFRDRVEPRLTRLEVFGVETHGVDGIVIIRVGKSRLAPHRITESLICPIRRASRTESMTMQEIQDMTLNNSRGNEIFENRMSSRCNRLQHEFSNFRKNDVYGVRVTAIPLGNEIQFERIYQHSDLLASLKPNWRRIFRILNNEKSQLSFPVLWGNYLPSQWRPVLRGARADNFSNQINRCMYLEIYFDGLAEVGFVIEKPDNWSQRFYIHELLESCPINIISNVGVWADQIRQKGNSPTMEYALQIQYDFIKRTGESSDFDNQFQVLRNIQNYSYPLNDVDNFSSTISSFSRDLLNARGIDGEDYAIEIENWPL